MDNSTISWHLTAMVSLLLTIVRSLLELLIANDVNSLTVGGYLRMHIYSAIINGNQWPKMFIALYIPNLNFLFLSNISEE